MVMDLITTYPVKKSDLGFHGNLFGGKLLSILDAAAVAYAMQLCDTPRMVTVSIDKCIFEKPTKEGQLLKIFGWPAVIGTTSVTLYMEARSHNVRTGKQNIVLKTHTKFVYIDEDGNPIPLKEKSVKRLTTMIEKNKTNEESI
jgi:acyl-CoA thioesterase YciA